MTDSQHAPLPRVLSGFPYVRILDWDDIDTDDLDIYLVARGPGFWLSQGLDLISIPLDAMEQFVAALIQAGVELGQP